MKHCTVGINDVVAACHEYHEPGRRTDEKRIDINRERLNQALLDRMRNRRRRGCMRRSALACLIGINAALHAPGDGGAKHAAQNGIHAEGAREDEPEDMRNLLIVDADDDDGDNDVGLRHEGNDDARELGDASQAAENNEAEKRRDNCRSDRRLNLKSLRPGGGNRVALNTGAEKDRSEDRNDREGPGIGLAVEAFFNIKGRAAAVLSVNLFLIYLTERRFHKGGRGAEEGNHPHPEQGAGAAEADGRGDASDVARADAACKRHGERLEAREPDVVFLLLEDEAPHLGNHADLNEPGADGEKEARTEAESHQHRRPDDAVQSIDEAFHVVLF